MFGKTHIYYLKDPRTNLVRYVGQTCNPQKRKRSYLTAQPKCCGVNVLRWLSELALSGLVPVFDIVETCDCENANIAEAMHIKLNSGTGLLLNKVVRPFNPERKTQLAKSSIVVCVNTGQRFSSLSEAARFEGVSDGSMSNYCRKKMAAMNTGFTYEVSDL
jgi:hypothetical protein